MTNFIEHKQRDGDDFILWTLLDAAGQPVPVGAVLTSATDSDHRSFKVSGGRPPHHDASTGRVYGEWLDNDNSGEYFPHVFDCKWLKVEKSLGLTPPAPVAIVPTPDPAAVLSRALGEMVREMLPDMLPELIRATVQDMADGGYFIDMANDGDYDDAIQTKLDDGDYMTPDSWDASDYADEIRETASVDDIKEDIADIIRDMMRDNALVVKFNPDH
tara:strand:+ start:315 stop:962 length:648 start_codon:yes stop_codon:yes gene_type:complete